MKLASDHLFQAAKNAVISFENATENIRLTNQTRATKLGVCDFHMSDFQTKESNILLLTTSLLIDRMFLYSGFLEKLTQDNSVEIWSDSYSNPRYKKMWSDTLAVVKEFPQVRALPLPHNYLRRFNEFAWDYRQKMPSRVSMERHRRQKRSLIETKALRPAANLLAFFGMERWIENGLESILQFYNRSQSALEQLKANKPDVLVVTGAFQFQQPAIAALAKKLGIPVLCLIPSWDNLSTKNRMVFKYDGYIIWSEQMKKLLHGFYPDSRRVPVYVTGAAQFDVFFQPKFYQTRREFCFEQNLNPALPIIVYALGSPNFLTEHHGALHLAEQVANEEFGKAQLLIRPHPLFDKGELIELFESFAPQVRVQQPIAPADVDAPRSQDARQITEWVNTFRHADVVVNLSSTVTVDAAIFDRPVINLDFDPQPGQPDQVLIKEINHLWTHFKPVAESGGVWLVNNFEELTQAVKTYLNKPELHRARRRWIAEHVCGYLDGKNSERMAAAILSFQENG